MLTNSRTHEKRKKKKNPCDYYARRGYLVLVSLVTYQIVLLFLQKHLTPFADSSDHWWEIKNRSNESVHLAQLSPQKKGKINCSWYKSVYYMDPKKKVQKCITLSMVKFLLNNVYSKFNSMKNSKWKCKIQMNINQQNWWRDLSIQLEFEVSSSNNCVLKL